MARPGPQRPSRIASFVARSRAAILGVAGFSGIVNILSLTGSFYMLQVYDRVLASRSVATLVAISLLCVGLFALQGLLEVVRTQVMSRVGARLERDLLKPVHDLVCRLPLAGRSSADVTQPVRDMESLRAFMSGQAPIAFLDLPWMPLYLAFIFLLHPLLGWVSVGGMLVLVTLTLLTEFRMRDPARDVASATARRFEAVDATRRNAEVLQAMGFADKAATRFFKASADQFKATELATDISGTLGSISRTFRMALQSAILGVGAWLVLKNQMSAGAIIACSILSGRAMAPVELAIANWRLFSTARQARQRLDELIGVMDRDVKPMALDLPTKTILVENLAIAPPGSRVPTIRNARLVLAAGDGIAILGPSGAGKSTLARGLVGAWPSIAGAVRFDGAPLEQYSSERLGQMIGYLPQDVELFDGTIAENIARLDPDADEATIIAAARAAHVHEMILRLPDGYKTKVGGGGFSLSVGQRQRVGLARAMFGNPFLVVLDEPNAHLDQEGDIALAQAISDIRTRKGIAVVVSHRKSILAGVNLAAFVADGEVKGFGPRDEIIKRIEEGMARQAQSGGQENPPDAVPLNPAAAGGAPSAPAPVNSVPSSPAPVSNMPVPLRNHPGLLQSGGMLSGRMPNARVRVVPSPGGSIVQSQNENAGTTADAAARTEIPASERTGS